MKNSIFKLSLLIFGVGIVSAQENKIVTSLMVNLNRGSSSSDGISNNLALNPNIGANFFWGKIGAGLDVGTFYTNADFDIQNYIQKNSGRVKSVQLPTNRETLSSTYFLVGPQYAIRKGKINFILAAKAGITMNKMPEYQLVDEASQQTLAQYKTPDDFAKNAFTIKPSLSIGYDLSKSFSVNANAQFIKQIGQQEFSTSFKDLSGVKTIDEKGNQLRQTEITKSIEQAQIVTSTTKGASEFISFGLGLIYNIRNSRGKSAEAKGNVKALHISGLDGNQPNNGSATFGEKVNAGMASENNINSGTTTNTTALDSGEPIKNGWNTAQTNKFITNPDSGKNILDNNTVEKFVAADINH